MARTGLLVSVLAATAAAQARFASNGFKYVGCVQADPAVFGAKIDFFKAFTADQCMKACGGSHTVAALSTGCSCGSMADGERPYKKVDESRCSAQCVHGDDKSGHCGGASSDAKHELFNLYTKDVNFDRTDDITETDCEEDEPTSLPENSQVPLPVSTSTQTVTPLKSPAATTLETAAPEATAPEATAPEAVPIATLTTAICDCAEQSPAYSDVEPLPSPASTTTAAPADPEIPTEAPEPAETTTSFAPVATAPVIGGASRPTTSVTSLLGLTVLVFAFLFA